VHTRRGGCEDRAAWACEGSATRNWRVPPRSTRCSSWTAARPSTSARSWSSCSTTRPSASSCSCCRPRPAAAGSTSSAATASSCSTPTGALSRQPDARPAPRSSPLSAYIAPGSGALHQPKRCALVAPPMFTSTAPHARHAQDMGTHAGGPASSFRHRHGRDARRPRVTGTLPTTSRPPRACGATARSGASSCTASWRRAPSRRRCWPDSAHGAQQFGTRLVICMDMKPRSRGDTWQMHAGAYAEQPAASWRARRDSHEPHIACRPTCGYWEREHPSLRTQAEKVLPVFD